MDMIAPVFATPDGPAFAACGCGTKAISPTDEPHADCLVCGAPLHDVEECRCDYCLPHHPIENWPREALAADRLDTLEGKLYDLTERLGKRPAAPAAAKPSPEPHTDGQPAELPQWWETPPDLDNLPPDPPALLARTDGKTLIPRDSFIEIFGAPSSGKSWLALKAIAANIAGGGRTLLWLWEGSPVHVYQCLRLLGVPDADATNTDLLRVAVGTKHPTATIAAGPGWVTDGDDPLAIIDTTAQAGGATNDAIEAVEWMHSHIAPWRNLGATVITIDHDTKNRPDTANCPESRNLAQV